MCRPTCVRRYIRECIVLVTSLGGGNNEKHQSGAVPIDRPNPNDEAPPPMPARSDNILGGLSEKHGYVGMGQHKESAPNILPFRDKSGESCIGEMWMAI